MSGGIGFTPAVDRKPAVLGGPLRVVQVSKITAAGTTSVTVPTGASVCDAYVRGPGGTAVSPQAGGGGAEEFATFSVAPGTVITATVGSPSTSLSSSSTISYGGTALASAAGGNGGNASGTGGVASATGYSGSNGASAANAAGGNSGAFVGPGKGGFGSSGVVGSLNGVFGGGGGCESGVSGTGGAGQIILIFRG